MTRPGEDAAAVVLLRDGPAGLEALLLRRDSGLAVADGHRVFPGGRAEESVRRGAGYESGNAEAAGPRQRLWMLADRWRYERNPPYEVTDSRGACRGRRAPRGGACGRS